MWRAAVVLLLLSPARAQETDKARGFDAGHGWWGAVLKSRVSGGRVDYRGLKDDPYSLLEYLRQIGGTQQESVRSWSRDEQLAFWLNAYNAAALRIVIERYPIRARWIASLRYPANSIRQIHAVFDKLTQRVAGKPRSLDEIEHGILRPEFREPRIHMALVCAAKGCPQLRDEPYTGASLDPQLEDQSLRFIRDPEKFRISRRDAVIWVSPIFKWFGEDFAPRYAPLGPPHTKDPVERAILGFARKYLDDVDRRFIDAGGYRVRFLDYDWSLNER